MAPMANYISARQSEPSQFKTHRYAKNAGGTGVDFVYGIRGKAGPSGGHSQLQAVRFAKTHFDKASAKTWLTKHNMKTTMEDTMSGIERLKTVLKEGAATDPLYDIGSLAVFQDELRRVVQLMDWKGIVAAVEQSREGGPPNFEYPRIQPYTPARVERVAVAIIDVIEHSINY